MRWVPIAGMMLVAWAWNVSAGQEVPSVRTPDSSDWWSTLRTADSDEVAKIQEREISADNYRILGIKLDNKMFAKAAAKLGRATEVTRGDASTGRDQICYVSKAGAKKVYLIFETGEVDFDMYLFVGGKPWNGSEYCVVSPLVTSTLGMSSGLRLGLPRAEVKAILGAPSRKTKNEWEYTFSVKKKLPPGQLRDLRKANPEMSDEEFYKNYSTYDSGGGVLVRFENGKVVYLSVSRSETM